MINFKKLEKLTIYPDLLNDMNSILSYHNISLTSQICLTDIEENSFNIQRGTGSLAWDWKDNKKIRKDKILRESDFRFLCEQFKNSIFEDIYNELKSHYDIGRVRLMRIPSGSSMIWHTDDTCRIHYPIKTQEGCFMVIDNEICHLDQDTWWYTETKKPHTAFNSSEEDRIHLVACSIG